MPSDTNVQGSAFDRLSISSLPGVAGGLAAIFAVFALLNAFALAPPVRLPVVAGNLLAAALNAAVAWAARRGWIAAGGSVAATALLHLLSIGVVLNAYRLLEDPMRAVFVSLGIVSAGWFVLSLPWLLAVIVAAVAGWAAVGALIAGEAAAVGQGVFYLLASAMLAVVVQRVRRRNFSLLARSEAELRDLVDNGGVLVQSVGADGVVRFVNRAWSRLLGYAPEEVIGRPIFDFIHGDGKEHCRRLFSAVLDAGERHDVEIELCSRDGAKRVVQGAVTVQRQDGRPLYTRGFFRDVSESRRLEGELRSRDELLRQVAEHADKVFWAFDVEEQRFTYVSPGFAALAGWPPEELRERPALFFELFHPEDEDLARSLIRATVDDGRVKVDHRLRHRGGEERWVHLEATLVADGSCGGRRIVGVSEDITDRKRQEQAYERLASLDSLTGLANRRRFDATILDEWRRHRRSGRTLSLLIVDVDRFKRLNDTFGHAAGDDCLKEVARALERSVQRGSDLAARIGGEEFAVVLPDTPADGALEIAERVHAEVAAIEPRGYEVPSVSIGVASRVPGDDEADSIVAAADQALYVAKRAGRNRTEVVATAEETTQRGLA